MQNIQDLKEKIFFESQNIIDNLDKISNVDELLSKQDLVEELANRISFLKLLEKNIEYLIPENASQNSENQQNTSFVNEEFESHDSGSEVTEEEAIFNNEFNEIDENEENAQENFSLKNEEEAIFNNQINEIVENELHEGIVNFVDENKEKESNESDLNFVNEDLILAKSKPENNEDIQENMFDQKTTEEEAIFNNQLNEIDEFENEISENQGDTINDFDEEQKIQFSFEPELNKASENDEKIPDIFDSEILEDEEEILIEENEEHFVASHVLIEQGEMATDTSNVDNILSEIKHDAQIEEKRHEAAVTEEFDRRKIVDINKPQIEKEIHPSDESFEKTDDYHQEKKIKLSNIKGLKGVQTLFDDDPLEREIPVDDKPAEQFVVKQDTGSIIKTNIPTNFMEAEKKKPEFKLDLNDRIAFSKMLFGGSQSELNDVVSELNKFKNLEEAKEFLSDLYYSKKWNKVDEYAQRLWILVENKFL